MKGWATRDLSRGKENIFGRNLSNNIFKLKIFHEPELSVYPLDGGEVGAGVDWYNPFMTALKLPEHNPKLPQTSLKYIK